ncbi:MAG: hypothetical protein H0V79_07755 [Actinobacteria bacterium]|nr:hypothetical protein [Actinomycetota bacterium]
MLLSSPFLLHGVDVEALAWRVIAADRRLDLRHHQREELAGYLIAEIWRLSLRFEPGRGSFAGFAHSTARLRVTDWLRAEFGRTIWKFSEHSYERERPGVVSLDSMATDERDRVDRTLTAREGDPAGDRDPDLRGLEADRDRTRALDYGLLGLDPPRRAAG